MSEATQKMIDDLNAEIERLERESADNADLVRQWQERAEKAERFNWADWFGYVVGTALVGVAAAIVAFGLWHFIHWAAQPDAPPHPSCTMYTTPDSKTIGCQ